MGIERHLDTPLAEAVRRAGGQSPLGRMIGRSQSTVFDWLKFNKPLPAEHVLDVERGTGVPKEVLRPDIYPAEPSAPPSDDSSPSVGLGGAVAHCDRAALLKRGDA